MPAFIRKILMVRDPRDQMSLLRPAELARESQRTCDLMRQNMAYGGNLYADNYMLVRFEDATERPLEVAAELLAFLGVPRMPVEVRQWLDEAVESRRGEGDPLAEVNAWRSKLTLNETQQIQESCELLLRELDYVPFDTEKELQDLTKRSFK